VGGASGGWGAFNTGELGPGGGIGVQGEGGAAAGVGDYGGPGGSFQGGAGTYNTRYESDGGDGVDAFGGQGGYESIGIYAETGNLGAPGGWAGLFSGDVDIAGNLSKTSGSFKIDHPLDPANKYLYHSFVESPDMMNIYAGNVVTDSRGFASVTLPDWFEALNRDITYQLTTVGQQADAWHGFAIQTGKPNVKVSWQVTGIRQDAWANAHRIPTEAEKAPAYQGHYLHPELFGHAGEPSIPPAAVGGVARLVVLGAARLTPESPPPSPHPPQTPQRFPLSMRGLNTIENSFEQMSDEPSVESALHQAAECGLEQSTSFRNADRHRPESTTREQDVGHAA